MTTSKKYKIAIAAETELYLPLYLARDQNWYGELNNGVEIELEKPINDNEDGDQWVFEMIHTSDDYLIGVGDPFKVQEYRENHNTDVKVIGGLVMKVAFWGYDTNTECNDVLDVEKFHHIVCPFKGMTGHEIFRLTEKLIKKNRNQNWSVDCDYKVIDGLFSQFKENLNKKNKHNTLLITPNIYEIEKSNKISPNQYKMVYSYATHPSWGDMITTGIISKNNANDDRKKVIQGIMNAIQLALVEIHSECDNSITSLLKIHGDDSKSLKDSKNEVHIQKYKSAATECIHEMVESNIFPLDLRITTASWGNRMLLHEYINNGTHEFDLPSQTVVEKKFNENVESRVATEAFKTKIIQNVLANRKYKINIPDPIKRSRIALPFLIIISGISSLLLIGGEWQETKWFIAGYFSINMFAFIGIWEGGILKNKYPGITLGAIIATAVASSLKLITISNKYLVAPNQLFDNSTKFLDLLKTEIESLIKIEKLAIDPRVLEIISNYVIKRITALSYVASAAVVFQLSVIILIVYILFRASNHKG